MIINIRKGIFETNSSSMHSLAYRSAKPNMDDLSTWDEDHWDLIKQYTGLPLGGRESVIYLQRDDLGFGWGFDILDNFYLKFCYAVASYLGMADEDYIRNKTLTRDIKKFLIRSVHDPHIKDFQVANGKDYGWIDHQSSDVLLEFVGMDTGDDGMLREKRLNKFLFDPDIYVLVDNDNRFPEEIKDTHEGFHIIH